MDRFLPALPPDMDLQDFLEEPLALGPVRPDDAREAPRPKSKVVTATAEALKDEHDLRITQAREFAEWLEGSRGGYFADDEEDIENGVVEHMPLLDLWNGYAFRCGFIASMDPYPRLLNRDALNRDEAIAVEDLIAYDFQCEERQYAQRYGALLRMAEPAHLQRYGMIVGLDTLNPDDPSCGLDMSTIDPLTVFPVWGGKAGPIEVYRVYEDTSDNIVGNYGGTYGSREYDRIARIVRKIAGESSRTPKHETSWLTVIECWNHDWLQVVLPGDRELLTRKHGYNRLPFTITVGNFELPAGVTSGMGKEPYQLSTAYGQVTVSDASTDLARQLRPYGWRRLKSHAVAEAVHTRMLTALKEARNPHKVLEYDPLSSHQPQVSEGLPAGEVSRVPIPGKLSTINPIIDPQMMAPLQMALQGNMEQGPLAQLRAGAIPPQTSDSALGTMLELGSAGDTVLVRALELHKRRRAELRLQYRLEWGDTMGYPGERGILRVPARQGSSSRTPLHAVTPAMIRRTGCQVDVELFHWRPNVGAAQYMVTLQQAGLVAEETARRRLKVVPDPDRERDRIEDEQLHKMPQVLYQDSMARLEALAEQADEEGDTESADRMLAALAAVEFMYDQLVMSGQAPDPNAPPGGGQMPPQMTPPPPPRPQLPGTSLPPQGIEVGNMGSRPARPQAATPPTPVTPVIPRA